MKLFQTANKKEGAKILTASWRNRLDAKLSRLEMPDGMPIRRNVQGNLGDS
jgi:hypothetical protein